MLAPQHPLQRGVRHLVVIVPEARSDLWFQEALRARIRELADQRKRWGYRIIHTVLRRDGWRVNRKRVQRLYREEGLAVRRRGKKRRSQVPRPVRAPLAGRTERWSMDFMSDTLRSGLRFRCLTIIDEFSRECLAIHVAHSIPAVGVIAVLERLREERGLPNVIVTDNGSEFTSRASPSGTLRQRSKTGAAITTKSVLTARWAVSPPRSMRRINQGTRNSLPPTSTRKSSNNWIKLGGHLM